MVSSVEKNASPNIFIYIYRKRGSCNFPCHFPNVLVRPRPWMVDLEIKMTKAQRESCKERSAEKEVVKVKKQGGKVSVLGPQCLISESVNCTLRLSISTDASEQGII